MARNHFDEGQDAMQYEDRDRNPTGTPEKVKKRSKEAEKELKEPKEQPDHIQPEPNKNFSDNQK